MSGTSGETETDPPGEDDANAAATEAADAEATEGDAEPEPQPEPEPEPEPQPKLDPAERRIARLTARGASLEREAEEYRRRAEAAEALLSSRGDDGTGTQPVVNQAAEIERRAAEMVETKSRNQRLVEIDTHGQTDYGADGWAQRSQYLIGVGAMRSPAFAATLPELPNAHKVAAHYADDPDALAVLLAKPPVALAAEMGRVSARLETPAARATLSSAPRPPTPVRAAAVATEADPERMSMDEYNAWRAKSAPRSLGGRGR